MDSSELRIAQIFLELLSIVSGHKHEVLLNVFLLVAIEKVQYQTNVTLSTFIGACNLLCKVLENVKKLIGFYTSPLGTFATCKGANSVDQPDHTALLTSKQQEGQVSLS